ncbi:hypothetical protein MKX03_025263 [Papaver bracteatum]|nr:hypothetical protein MKX03_025263 [Papaver bracteatum]
MRYEFANELEVNACADDVWAIFSGPNFPILTVQLLPDILKSKDILEGDGCSVGTIMSVVFHPEVSEQDLTGVQGEVDHKKRRKEIQAIEGGCLDMGCTFSILSFEILLAKERNSCVIRTVNKHEVIDDLVTTTVSNGHLHTYFDACVTLVRGVAKHIAEQNAIAR